MKRMISVVLMSSFALAQAQAGLSSRESSPSSDESERMIRYIGAHELARFAVPTLAPGGATHAPVMSQYGRPGSVVAPFVVIDDPCEAGSPKGSAGRPGVAD